MFVFERGQTRKRREKCSSEILVYGFILARVNPKPKPWVERLGFCNRRRAAALQEIPDKNQEDSGERARLTRPQGALRYTAHNEGKETGSRELA
jgi:hypothetical protein